MPPTDDQKQANASTRTALDRATSEFIAVTAHKVHTPVTSIKWQAETLINGDLGPINEEQRLSLQSIMEAAEHLNDLSRALLYVFELEKDLPMMHPQDVDIHQLVLKVTRHLDALAKERGVRVHCETCATPLTVYVDSDLVFVVLRTLLENAIFYSSAKSEVRLRVEPKERGVEVLIEDKGCGIPPDLHNLVFTKFFRAPNARRLWTEGSGLGLYIAKNIAERTGGNLAFVSEEGKGTTFRWFIPAHTVGRMPWERGT